jgi:translation initiation factor IF-1
MSRRRESGDAERSSGAAPSASQVDGIVREQLEYALYRVELDGHHEVIAHAPGGPHRNFVRLLAGDRVRVEISLRDAKRGRIVKKL